jgi:hypothetical protein
MVLPTSIELIDDVRKAPDDALSGREVFREVRMTYVSSTRAHLNYNSSLSWTTPSTS